MLAPSAATLPAGSFLIEPYVFDVIARGRYDRTGVRRRDARADTFGCLTYVMYGLADLARMTRSLARLRPFLIAADWRPTLLADRLDPRPKTEQLELFAA